MMHADGAVYIVDDDALVRDSLAQLVRSIGLTTATYASASDFLAATLPDGPGCLVLDIRMPGLSGLDLQDELVKRGHPLPIIFITGHGTVPMSVRAMKAGAMDFLQKPFEDQELIDRISLAIKQDRLAKQDRVEVSGIRDLINSLTNRERDVLYLVTAGRLNKQIAYDLQISENTVKTHRARVMRKMRVESLADLIKAVGQVEPISPID